VADGSKLAGDARGIPLEMGPFRPLVDIYRHYPHSLRRLYAPISARMQLFSAYGAENR
jgi:hypothetical protein